ncbi:MAG: hypothetical protein IKT57_07125 [Clostridia bacterium]|nr:hypothetical protein [Clostridia bacterium]
MNEKKELWVSIISLIVILAVAIALILMDSPMLLLVILPLAILHIVRLHSLKKKQQNSN